MSATVSAAAAAAATAATRPTVLHRKPKQWVLLGVGLGVRVSGLGALSSFLDLSVRMPGLRESGFPALRLESLQSCGSSHDTPSKMWQKV